MTPEQTLDWLAQQHWDQCREERPIQDWIRKMKSQLPDQAQKQEPVAMQMDVIVVNLVREGINKHRARELAEHFIKHTSPPQRQWVGLTDDDLRQIILAAVGVAEAKLKEKNT